MLSGRGPGLPGVMWLLVFGAIGLTVLMLGEFMRQRRRRARQAAARTSSARRSQTVTGDSVDDWLLGLAAPWIEVNAFHHDRWHGYAEGPSAVGVHRVQRELERWGVPDRASWLHEVTELERLGHYVDDQMNYGPWLTSRHAYLCRLAVGADYQSQDEARDRVARFAVPVLDSCQAWSDYGEQVLAAAERVDPESVEPLRTAITSLRRAGGPWRRATWPQ